MKSSVNRENIPRAPKKRRLSPTKWNRWPVQLQILASTAVAISIIAAIITIMPDTAYTEKKMLSLVAHEGGHILGVLVQSGEVHNLTLRPDGSGEVHVVSKDQALSAAMGPLMPPLLAAVFFTLGALRLGTSFWLLALSLPLFWIGYAHADEPSIKWALWAWAGFAFVFAVSGLPHTFRSAALMVIAITLALGTYDALPYLWVEHVPAHSAASLTPAPLSDPDPSATRLSDVRIIADALAPNNITEVRHGLITLMITFGLLAAAVIARFIYINRSY